MQADAPKTPALPASRSLAPRPTSATLRALRPTGLPQFAALVRLALRSGVARFRGGPEADVRIGHALAETLGHLKGPFAKVGQMLSLQIDRVPPAIRAATADLRDRVPPLPLSEIQPIVERELGRSLGEAFTDFEAMPLGAASIAQVHRATLPDGRPVAVKVQYPWLARSLPADLRVLRLAMRWVPGSAHREGMFDAFARGIHEELDFEREADQAKAIAANLASYYRLVVQIAIASHSTKRLLTMEWFPTIAITPAETLTRRGVPTGAVMEVLGRAYARQVFVDGVFHADPHPGNLFVIDEPEATSDPRVLFVDFGLSQRLDPALRRELRAGIYAVLQGDGDAFLAAMGRMDMIAPGAEEGVRTAVDAMLGKLRGDSGSPLGLSGDRILALKDEAKDLLYDTPGLDLPTDLLLYAKTISYLFALGGEIAPDVDLMKISVPYLLKFLASKDG